MRFVRLRDLNKDSTALQAWLQNDEEVILTEDGKAIGLFTPLGSANFEEELRAIRRARAKAALDRIRERASVSPSSELSPSQIDEIIRRTRRSHNN